MFWKYSPESNLQRLAMIEIAPDVAGCWMAKASDVLDCTGPFWKDEESVWSIQYVNNIIPS